MAEVRGNFIAGKMNKSVDERLVPEGEYVDALNVRLGSTETTEVGAVENSKGNDQLTFLQYAGNPLSSPAVPGGLETTFCLGTYEDGMQETIYWFVHDSFNFAASPLTGKVDMIVSFNANSNTVTYHVVSVDDGGGVNTTLNFDPKFLVTGVNKIEDLLFFTDDKNAPRVINVNRNYDDPVAGVDGIETEDINVIVKPPGFEDVVLGSTPLTVPKVEPTDVPGDENYMETRFLCFAYRYRYIDGGYSPTSLFSLPSFQPRGFRFDLDNFNNAGMINRFNASNITFSTGSKRVIQVDLLYKESTSNVIYVIERYNKKVQGWADDGLQTVLFVNSKIFTTLGSDELLRQYDNVPRIAKAQTIQGNRLIYGNYVDGYDIEDANGQSIPIDYTTEHIVEEIGGVGLPQPISSNGAAYSIGQGGSNTIVASELTFDLTGLTEPILPGITFNFDVSIQSAPSTGPSPNPQGTGPDTDLSFQNTSPFSLSWGFTAQTTYATISDMVNSTAFQLPIGTTANANYQPLLPTDLSAQGGTLTDKFNNEIIAPPSTLLEKINSSITTSCSIAAPPLTAVCTQQGFNYTASATGFSIQCPALRYYSEDAPAAGDVSEQFEFFSFIDFQSTSGYLLTADTYSLHSNRDYETGIVYMDDYGRASTVLVARNNTIYVPPINSRDKNTIGVTLLNLPPYWATKYKFVVKPSEGDYFSVYSALYYESKDPSAFYFKLEGDNTNIITQGMNLIVKADTLGPVNSNVVCTVLEVVGLSDDDDRVGGSVSNLAGLYMLIKPGGFNTDLAPDAVINYGNSSSSSNSTSCNLSKTYNLLLPDGSAPYDLPAGSTVRVRIDNWRGSKGSGCTSKSYKFDQSFIVSQDYPNFYRWWYGDSVDMTTGTGNGISCQQFLLSGTAPYVNSTNSNNGSTSKGAACWKTRLFCYGNETTTLRFMNRCGIPRCSSFWGDKRPGHVGTLIEVTRGGNLIVWETEPNEVDPNLFYDASRTLDIYTNLGIRYHKAGVGASEVNQDASTNLSTTLKFANCFTFGNGVESFRITDSPGTKSFQLGERVLAVSNQEFKETDRFAGLTYSGVFSGPSNSNNLNEFNLGLANYKDCETSFGPIQVLHSRETDILVLQEDRISYVLSGKNVITDSTGGGAIASVPQVLGTQIARIEEYGISFNPESFAAWGSDMFFTDTKRGSVINIRGTSSNNDQIQIISQYGMRSWFRDQFADQLHTQKIGGYDPYMNEYVLSSNKRSIPVPIVATSCGTNLTQTNTVQTLSYTVNVGETVGDITIPYTIISGDITITATWNGFNYTATNVTTSGTITIPKTANTPNTVDIVIDVNGISSASYGITVDCPPQENLTIIRVVLSSPSTDGQFIHYDYNWTDGSTISPNVNALASLGINTPTEYISQTGVRSVGSFPYTGADITMRSLTQGFDDFVFDPLSDKFLILSSAIEYPGTPAGMSALLAAGPSNVTPISNPSAGNYQATETNFAMPALNTYLYLIWDLREVTMSELCFSDVLGSSGDACCDCSPTCTVAEFGPNSNSSADALLTDTNSGGSAQYSFNGSGQIPQIGEVCYENLTCDVQQYLPSGYYLVNLTSPSTLPKTWVEIGNYGAVIDAG